MEMPTVRSEIRDEKGRTLYWVMAYRTLTADELVQAMVFYELKHKRPKPNKPVTIISIIGYDE